MKIVKTYLKAFGRPFTYDPRHNVYLWFGFLWGLPVPLFSILLDLSLGGVEGRSPLRAIADHPIHLFFLAHPVLGVGPGGFIVSLDEVGLQVPQLEDLKPTPHNAFIQMAAEAGVFGLVAFTVFLLVLLRVLMRGLASLPRAGTGAEDPAGGERSLRRAVLWSFGVLCVGAFFDWPFPHGTGQVAMLVAAMGCAAVGRRESTEP